MTTETIVASHQSRRGYMDISKQSKIHASTEIERVAKTPRNEVQSQTVPCSDGKLTVLSL